MGPSGSGEVLFDGRVELLWLPLLILGRMFRRKLTSGNAYHALTLFVFCELAWNQAKALHKITTDPSKTYVPQTFATQSAVTRIEHDRLNTRLSSYEPKRF